MSFEGACEAGGVEASHKSADGGSLRAVTKCLSAILNEAADTALTSKTALKVFQNAVKEYGDHCGLRFREGTTATT